MLSFGVEAGEILRSGSQLPDISCVSVDVELSTSELESSCINEIGGRLEVLFRVWVDGSLANSPTPQLANSPSSQLASLSAAATDVMMQTGSRRVICCLHATRSRSVFVNEERPTRPRGWVEPACACAYATACKLSYSFPCAYGYCVEPHHVFSYYPAHISKLPDSPTPLLTCHTPAQSSSSPAPSLPNPLTP